MAHSGQVTVTTAGTEVRMTSQRGSLFLIKALPSNTGIMYVGNASDAVSSTTGYPLSAGEYCLVALADLSQLWVDSSVNGEKVAWLLVE